MAARRGFFEREGLKVETLEVKDDTIGVKALLSGDVDSYLGTAGALAAVARGIDVKFIGCPWHGIPYVVLGRSGISRVEELKGKSIAASSPGTPPDMVARAALASVNVPFSDVTFASVGADRERQQHEDEDGERHHLPECDARARLDAQVLACDKDGVMQHGTYLCSPLQLQVQKGEPQ